MKNAAAVELGTAIHDGNFSALLESLAKSSFIQNDGKFYSIIDPLLRHSFRGDK